MLPFLHRQKLSHRNALTNCHPGTALPRATHSNLRSHHHHTYNHTISPERGNCTASSTKAAPGSSVQGLTNFRPRPHTIRSISCRLTSASPISNHRLRPKTQWAHCLIKNPIMAYQTNILQSILCWRDSIRDRRQHRHSSVQGHQRRGTLLCTRGQTRR